MHAKMGVEETESWKKKCKQNSDLLHKDVTTYYEQGVILLEMFSMM